ncbi:Hypothetical protein POVN_LOCUS207 [uncultured virus]|nr:Hypothetical protein POVN_LOCUS207 [uncultured virus]
MSEQKDAEFVLTEEDKKEAAEAWKQLMAHKPRLYLATKDGVPSNKILQVVSATSNDCFIIFTKGISRGKVAPWAERLEVGKDFSPDDLHPATQYWLTAVPMLLRTGGKL